MAVDTTSQANRAYEIVEAMIVRLELPPGSLFSEAELSARIGIGRTPLREALQKLAQEGLLRAMPRRGVAVTEINITDYLAILETRRVLDRLIFSKAARRATQEQRRHFEQWAKQMEKAAAGQDLNEFLRLDRESDEALSLASRNSFAARARKPLHSHCRRFWYQYRHDSDIMRSAELHAAILLAVAEGNQTAAAVHSDKLIDHLEHFAREALDLR